MITLPVSEGALTKVPCYEPHKRGKNWAAIISPDPRSPGGLARAFLERAKGSYYYLVDGLAPGQVVEFGADYYTGSGRPDRKRVFGVVHAVTGTEVTIEEYSTAAQAFAHAKLPPDYLKLSRERDVLLTRLAEIDRELEGIAIQEDFGTAP